ncbi:hypothetical protein ACH50O_06095 [Methylomonas sp. 2BW1-5-20]|uniref:hypothetical protein n=1 Tax=Methylomonas sp. 2BW1-5-20 TaxID=3376686 RepID=UPI00404E7D9A
MLTRHLEKHSLEQDLPGIRAEPLLAVVKALTEHRTVEQVYDNLPDFTATNQ